MKEEVKGKAGEEETKTPAEEPITHLRIKRRPKETLSYLRIRNQGARGGLHASDLST